MVGTACPSWSAHPCFRHVGCSRWTDQVEKRADAAVSRADAADMDRRQADARADAATARADAADADRRAADARVDAATARADAAEGRADRAADFQRRDGGRGCFGCLVHLDTALWTDGRRPPATHYGKLLQGRGAARKRQARGAFRRHLLRCGPPPGQGAGRPRMAIDLAVVTRAASIGCTIAEIAALTAISPAGVARAEPFSGRRIIGAQIEDM